MGITLPGQVRRQRKKIWVLLFFMHIPYIKFQDPILNRCWPYVKHNGRMHTHTDIQLSWGFLRRKKNVQTTREFHDLNMDFVVWIQLFMQELYICAVSPEPLLFAHIIWAAAWQNQQNDKTLRCPHEETLSPKLPTERTAKTLISLGACPGWWVFPGRTGHFVGFVMRWLIYELQTNSEKATSLIFLSGCTCAF